MASLKYRLEGSPKGTLGGISYVFLLCFTVLLKQLWRLYTSGFIFQVPPVYNYSTCRTNHVFTCSVHQPLAYASSALMKHWLIRGDASVYRPRSLLQWNRQSPPSKWAYNTTSISCPWIRLNCIIKLIQTKTIDITQTAKKKLNTLYQSKYN